MVKAKSILQSKKKIMLDFKNPLHSRVVYSDDEYIVTTYGLGEYSPYMGSKMFDFKILDVRDIISDDEEVPVIEDYKRMINFGVKYLEEHKRLVVCCTAGISRSNAIAMGVLMKKFGFTFDQAFKMVNDSISNCRINKKHLEALKEIFN